MKKNVLIKFISVMLVLATLLTALPLTVFAEGVNVTTAPDVYIKDIKLQQSKDSNTARELLEGEGYISSIATSMKEPVLTVFGSAIPQRPIPKKLSTISSL